MQTKEVGGKILFSIFTKPLKFCFKMKFLLAVILFAVYSLPISAQLKNKHVLIFTKNLTFYLYQHIEYFRSNLRMNLTDDHAEMFFIFV